MLALWVHSGHTVELAGILLAYCELVGDIGILGILWGHCGHTPQSVGALWEYWAHSGDTPYRKWFGHETHTSPPWHKAGYYKDEIAHLYNAFYVSLGPKLAYQLCR